MGNRASNSQNSYHNNLNTTSDIYNMFNPNRPYNLYNIQNRYATSQYPFDMYTNRNNTSNNQGRTATHNKLDINLSKMPVFSLTYDELRQNPSCSICLEEFKLNETVYNIPCYHIFHKHCLHDWFEQKMICPNCKIDINVTNPKSCVLLRNKKLHEYKESRLQEMHNSKLSQLRIGDIKQVLKEHNVDITGVIEKSELIDLLLKTDPIVGAHIV